MAETVCATLQLYLHSYSYHSSDCLQVTLCYFVFFGIITPFSLFPDATDILFRSLDISPVIFALPYTNYIQ